MLRMFEDVSIKVAGVDVGRFAGTVEFDISANGADVTTITVADEMLSTNAPLVLTEWTNGITTGVLFNLLRSALIARYAQDILKITAAAKAREPAPLRSVA